MTFYIQRILPLVAAWNEVARHSGQIEMRRFAGAVAWLSIVEPVPIPFAAERVCCTALRDAQKICGDRSRAVVYQFSTVWPSLC